MRATRQILLSALPLSYCFVIPTTAVGNRVNDLPAVCPRPCTKETVVNDCSDDSGWMGLQSGCGALDCVDGFCALVAAKNPADVACEYMFCEKDDAKCTSGPRGLTFEGKCSETFGNECRYRWCPPETDAVAASEPKDPGYWTPPAVCPNKCVTDDDCLDNEGKYGMVPAIPESLTREKSVCGPVRCNSVAGLCQLDNRLSQPAEFGCGFTYCSSHDQCRGDKGPTNFLLPKYGTCDQSNCRYVWCPSPPGIRTKMTATTTTTRIYPPQAPPHSSLTESANAYLYNIETATPTTTMIAPDVVTAPATTTIATQAVTTFTTSTASTTTLSPFHYMTYRPSYYQPSNLSYVWRKFCCSTTLMATTNPGATTSVSAASSTQAALSTTPSTTTTITASSPGQICCNDPSDCLADDGKPPLAACGEVKCENNRCVFNAYYDFRECSEEYFVLCAGNDDLCVKGPSGSTGRCMHYNGQECSYDWCPGPRGATIAPELLVPAEPGQICCNDPSDCLADEGKADLASCGEVKCENNRCIFNAYNDTGVCGEEYFVWCAGRNEGCVKGPSGSKGQCTHYHSQECSYQWCPGPKKA